MTDTEIVTETREAFEALSGTAATLAGAGIDRAALLAASIQLVRVVMVEAEDRSIVQQVVEALMQ
jgi:hypothetical protein